MIKMKKKNISIVWLVLLTIFTSQLLEGDGQIAFDARDVRFNFTPTEKETDNVILIIEGAQSRLWRSLIVKTEKASVRVKNQDHLMQLSKFDVMSAQMYIHSVDATGKVKDLSKFHISFATKDKSRLAVLMIHDGALVSLKFKDFKGFVQPKEFNQ